MLRGPKNWQHDICKIWSQGSAVSDVTGIYQLHRFLVLTSAADLEGLFYWIRVRLRPYRTGTEGKLSLEKFLCCQNLCLTLL